jgi:dihydrolipoamide dehydrogenase
MEQYDIIVIGAGPGGYPAAIRAAQLGAKVAIVEREWLGGTCLNCGCIPTKTLIAGAELYQRIGKADKLGISVTGAKIDYPIMTKRKDKVVETLRNGVGSLLKANKITTYDGIASFIGTKSIAITSSEGVSKIKAEKIIIATGSTSALPGFIPENERILESRAFLELTKLPESLIVLGGGYIGCELACMAAALGVKVTIVELLDDILTLLDKDVRSVVKRGMKRELGIQILTGAPLENIEATASGVSASASGKKLEAQMLLVAVGRKPVTDGLNLNEAGLDTDENGFITVDQHSRTKVSSIYAIGDVSGRVQLAHAATSQGIHAAETACGKTLKPEERLVPGVIFTMPEVAVCGLTETEAEKKGVEIERGKFLFRGLGKALAANETEGFVKWIASAATGQLLGAQAVGPHATDLIAEACVAIRAELTAKEIGNTIHAHPTFSEIWMEAAHALHGTCIHAPPAG